MSFCKSHWCKAPFSHVWHNDTHSEQQAQSWRNVFVDSGWCYWNTFIFPKMLEILCLGVNNLRPDRVYEIFSA